MITTGPFEEICFYLSHAAKIFDIFALSFLVILKSCFVLFLLFRAAPMAYGSSLARGGIRATAAGL